MMEAYFDESGTHNKSLLVIAGFVSDADKWRAFEAHAEAIKRDFNIEYFHSKKKRNKHSSLYKHLSPSQSDDMEAALSKAVCECAAIVLFLTLFRTSMKA